MTQPKPQLRLVIDHPEEDENGMWFIEKQIPYTGLYFPAGEPAIQRNTKITRERAFRECVRQHRNFMAFVWVHEQHAEWIDANIFLDWLFPKRPQ